MDIKAYGMTDIGKWRLENQDQFLIGELRDGMSIQLGSVSTDRVLRFPPAHGTFFIVADGMGGHAGGRIASAVAVECFARYLRWKSRELLTPCARVLDHLSEGVCYCHKALRKMCNRYPDLRSMGTTLTAAYVLGKKAYIVHVGDSRCYLIRQGWAEQLTTDHTLAQLYTNANPTEPPPWKSTKEQQNKMSHVLWNCLGGREENLQIETIERELEPRDMLILCSDGLSKYIDRESMVAVATQAPSVETACHKLVAAANEAGGSDNVTVVLAECIAMSDSPSTHQVVNQATEETAAFDLPPRQHEFVSCD